MEGRVTKTPINKLTSVSWISEGNFAVILLNSPCSLSVSGGKDDKDPYKWSNKCHAGVGFNEIVSRYCQGGRTGSVTGEVGVTGGRPPEGSGSRCVGQVIQIGGCDDNINVWIIRYYIRILKHFCTSPPLSLKGFIQMYTSAFFVFLGCFYGFRD